MRSVLDGEVAVLVCCTFTVWQLAAGRTPRTNVGRVGICLQLVP